MYGGLTGGLFARQVGQQNRELSTRLSHDRTLSIEFSESKAPVAGSQGAGTPHKDECPALFAIQRGSEASHKFSVSCVAWYPIDTGMFVTGSFDHDVKVWDTNSLQVACRFAFPGRVYGLALSPVAVAHCLVAVVGSEPQCTGPTPPSGTWPLAAVMARCGYGIHGAPAVCMSLTSTTLRKPGQLAKRQAIAACTGKVAQAVRAALVYWHLLPPGVTAHDGYVTAVLPTPDGLYWLSAGTDSRVRLWDTVYHRNMLVNYSDTFNRSNKARQLALVWPANERLWGMSCIHGLVYLHRVMLDASTVHMLPAQLLAGLPN
ncbi:hypothetical protein WJX72_011350 [[Myrmecia] bisecta]|uniref:Uncharacterized protein n=1 Tax=[Myrmecia] bisecta TaxID=41462 RepID=A0AAW1Q882_9CHLO